MKQLITTSSMLALCTGMAPALFAQDASPEQIRSAATRPVALLQKGSPGFYQAQDCFSSHHGDDRMVNLLLRSGADPKVRNKAGETALSQAKRFQYPHIQTALEKAGARE